MNFSETHWEIINLYHYIWQIKISLQFRGLKAVHSLTILPGKKFTNTCCLNHLQISIDLSVPGGAEGSWMIPELRSCIPGAMLVGGPTLWMGLSWFILRGPCATPAPAGPDVRICKGTPAEGMEREGLAGTTCGNEMVDEVWMGETGTSWGMERGTSWAGVVPLVWGTGTTCVGEEMDITCGTWILADVEFVVCSPSWCAVRCERWLFSCEMETMVVAPSGRLVEASCCCCTSLEPVFTIWLWNWGAGDVSGDTGTSWGHWDTWAPEECWTNWETGIPWMEGTTWGREKTWGVELVEETTELQVFNWEPELAKTTYSPCWLERDTAEFETTTPAADMEAGRVRDSWVFCVKTSEGRLVGEDRVGEEGDKDEEEDTVWLLPSESGTLMKSIALLPWVLVCRGREMMDGGFDTVVELVLRTTAGRLLLLASMDETSRSTTETACCTPTLGLVITWAPFSIKGELVPTGLSVTVWQSPKLSPLIITPVPLLEIREFPLRSNDWGAVRKPPDPLRMSWPPVLQGTADREMMDAAEPGASSGFSGASSMGLTSSSVLWFPSDSLEQKENK